MPGDELDSLAAGLTNEGTEGRDVQNGQDAGSQPVATSEGDGRDEAEGLDAEGADEADDAGQVENPRRSSRRDARIETLLAQRTADKERADRLERQLDELRAARNQPQQRQESPEEEQARLALMTPEQRSDYRLEKGLRQMQEAAARSEFRAQEIADKAGFDAKVATDPLYARMAPAVEKTLQDLRAQGQNVPRQILFELEVGRAALAARAKTGDKKPAGGQRKPAAPALNGKGDTSAQRRRSGDTPAKRLENVQI